MSFADWKAFCEVLPLLPSARRIAFVSFDEYEVSNGRVRERGPPPTPELCASEELPALRSLLDKVWRVRAETLARCLDACLLTWDKRVAARLLSWPSSKNLNLPCIWCEPSRSTRAADPFTRVLI